MENSSDRHEKKCCLHQIPKDNLNDFSNYSTANRQGNKIPWRNFDSYYTACMHLQLCICIPLQSSSGDETTSTRQRHTIYAGMLDLFLVEASVDQQLLQWSHRCPT
jgi:hypothetical protein